MNSITLQNQTSNGINLEATFLPSNGMNMSSFKKGGIEVIDQSAYTLIDDSYIGLGALIGPHFYKRHPSIIPLIKEESAFPHIAALKSKGIQDPFPSGIGRYAPWQAECTQNSLTAVLSGKDIWNSIPLSALEGQNFKMQFAAELRPDGLHIEMSVVSDTDSLIGMRYAYHLPEGKAAISSGIQRTCFEQNVRKPIPEEWNLDSQQVMRYAFDRSVDYTFFPFPDPLVAEIFLETETYRLRTTYCCTSQENSWRLHHLAGTSFVCIEPVSSQDPFHPNLTVSALHIHLQILD